MTAAPQDDRNGKSAPGRPKAPGTTVLALTAGLAVIVAVTGLTSRAASPPTVAQFAPQAVKQIKQAPRDQSSDFGDGKGEGGGGGGRPPSASPSPRASASPSSSPSPAPPGPPVTRRCVGNPPRQIEDSQSPPCVPFWQGDNGGSTWQGVTADEVRIAVPQWPRADAGDEVRAMQDFFNRRFEFYGRKLVLFDPGVNNSDVPETQRNDAAKVDSLNAFGSIGYSYNHYYSEELARRQIVSVTSEPYYTEAQLQKWAPHVWQYSMSMDGQLGTIGAWVCNRVAGRNATHAGDTAMHAKPRKFGIVSYNTFPELPVDLRPLIDRMKGCGAEPAVVLDQGTVGNAISPTEAQNTAAQLQNAGVTSVVCTCNYVQLAMLYRGATAQVYFPEWLLGTYFFNDSDYALHQFNGDQAHLDHSYGVTFQPRELRAENTPATWAVKEGSGRPDSAAGQTSGNIYNRRRIYRELLLLASGIQMAGPTLTPQTFEAGLHRAVFPNPDDGLRQGEANFLGDHTMTDDAAEFYWSSSATSPYADTAGQGAFCYVDGGRRRTLSTWPRSEPPLGRMPCDSRDK